MAGFQELQKRYENIPQELKAQRRWVCFKAMIRNGKKTKIPVSPLSKETLLGAPSNDSSTWSDFDQAVRFCADRGMDGLGFELGEGGMFALDISNEPDEKGNMMPQAEFQEMANDFVKTMNSYTEWSVSKNGIHIICYGSLPKNLKKIRNVEVYDSLRFFAMTGNNIGLRTVMDRTEEAAKILDKYASKKESSDAEDVSVNLGSLTDDEVLANTLSSKYSAKISKLMDGDCSDYGGNKEEAEKALCSFLAYYSMCNEEQVDRIFRNSKLYDERWDAPEGGKTHGYFVIQNAVESCAILHLPSAQAAKEEPKQENKKKTSVNEMNLGPDGEPIFRVSENYNKIGKKYTLDDTGNARRFYDCFGENFHWDIKNKAFMFWTGKTWVYDESEIIRKYANKLIELLSEEANQKKQAMINEPDEGRKKRLYEDYINFYKNVKHLSNKSGKDAMITEFRSLGSIPVEPTDFDKDPLTINTESGIVDLTTGEILPFDKEKMMAANTHMEVSFEESPVWDKFLHDIFFRDNEQETEEIIECYQRCIGYTLTGLSTEQCMFLLNGEGSNGKSTQANVIKGIMGDYYGFIDPSMLMVQKNKNQSVQYSLAELLKVRYLSSSETDKGERLSESVVKQITGSTDINAQKKFGRPFHFLPLFKLWMDTNNLPYISGKDYAIWRRIFFFSFKRRFAEGEKDKMLPEKLKAEYPRILGWAVKGAVKYLTEHDLKQPECLSKELAAYKESFDGVAKFIMSECVKKESGMVSKAKMYHAYKQWAMDNKEHAYPESKFRDELISKGFRVSDNQATGSQYYVGLILNGEMDTMMERRGYINSGRSAFEDD